MPKKARRILRNLVIAIVAAFGALVVLGFVLTLTGYEAPETTAAPSTSATSTATTDVAPTPTAEEAAVEPTPEQTSVTPRPAEAAPEPTPIDRLMAELQGENFAGQVAGVTTEDRLVIVDTKLIDPRQDSSPEGMIAATICNAAERAFGDDKTVRVQERDGTTFATNQFGECEEY